MSKLQLSREMNAVSRAPLRYPILNNSAPMILLKAFRRLPSSHLPRLRLLFLLYFWPGIDSNRSLLNPMKNRLLALAFSFVSLCLSLQAATYSGNGNSGFGGPIGLGSLTFTDNGTTISGTINKGPNGLNDVLVLYIDSLFGGFSSTSGFADGADGLRRAISGFDGGPNRSLLAFNGMTPDYAIALGPASDNFGGLWQLANGGANSHNFIAALI